MLGTTLTWWNQMPTRGAPLSPGATLDALGLLNDCLRLVSCSRVPGGHGRSDRRVAASSSKRPHDCQDRQQTEECRSPPQSETRAAFGAQISMLPPTVARHFIAALGAEVGAIEEARHLTLASFRTISRAFVLRASSVALIISAACHQTQ